MQVVNMRCCGLDVHQKTVVACVVLTEPTGEVQREVRTFGTMTGDLLALNDWLNALAVEQVALESTGVYWRPVFNLLEADHQIMLVNAQHLKAVPGRKTDVKDSEWLADLLRHGLVKASFIPPQPVRELRELTRYRKTLVQARAQEVNRLHKVLEGANLKLGAVATDVLGTSGRDMLAAILAGEADPAVLADLARGRLRAKLPQLRQALEGRVTAQHRVLIRHVLAHIDFLEQQLAELIAEIEAQLAPFAEAVTLLETIPGVAEAAATAIVAEVGVDMTRFPSAKHLASWAGLCPGNKQSGGRRLSGKTTTGNVWLRAVLGEVAWSITHTSGNYLAALYHRLARRRGKQKAIVALAHSLLVSIYYMLRDHQPYRDLGADHFDRLQSARIQRHYVRRLEQLGYAVTLSPSPAP
ncbi:MAG: IS110 family transposase [Nitrososphaerota archaeon]